MKEIRVGPPGPGEEPTIDDEGLSYLILGTLRGCVAWPDYPIKVREVRDDFDDDGDIKSFTIITESGLKYQVRVDLLDEEPPL